MPGIEQAIGIGGWSSAGIAAFLPLYTLGIYRPRAPVSFDSGCRVAWSNETLSKIPFSDIDHFQILHFTITVESEKSTGFADCYAPVLVFNEGPDHEMGFMRIDALFFNRDAARKLAIFLQRPLGSVLGRPIPFDDRLLDLPEEDRRSRRLPSN